MNPILFEGMEIQRGRESLIHIAFSLKTPDPFAFPIAATNDYNHGHWIWGTVDLAFAALDEIGAGEGEAEARIVANAIEDAEKAKAAEITAQAAEGSKALDNLESIDKAQRRVRTGRDGGRRIIDSIEWTEQTLENQLRAPYDPSDWE